MPNALYFASNVPAEADTKKITLHWARTEWQRASLHCTRKPPATPDSSVPPFLTLPKSKHRLLCALWLLHRFPYPWQEESRRTNSKLDLALRKVEQLMSLHQIGPSAKEKLASAIEIVQAMCPKNEEKPPAPTIQRQAPEVNSTY